MEKIERDFGKKDLPDLRLAVRDCRVLISDYQGKEHGSVLLLDCLVRLEKKLVDTHFDLCEVQRPAKKTAKKLEKVGRSEKPSVLKPTSSISDKQKKGGEGHADMRNV
jgi:hypothetical protein